MTLGERIKLKRKEIRLTQKQLADMMGIDHTTISKWESNIYEPDTKSLNTLSQILSVSTDYLLGSKTKRIEEVDPETRALARDIQTLESGDKELLKGLIRSMRNKGKEAKGE